MQEYLVDSVEKVSILVDDLQNLSRNGLSLFLLMEGHKLSRNGNLSIVLILVPARNKIYLFDVILLGSRAFNTPGMCGFTFKTILERPDITKIVFDVRKISDILFSHYDICLAGIQDLQLMELASRQGTKEYNTGIWECFHNDAGLTPQEKEKWVEMDNAALEALRDQTGKKPVVLKRPLPDALTQFALQAIRLFPVLFQNYQSKLSATWMTAVTEESIKRVKAAQELNFKIHGTDWDKGPSSWPLMDKIKKEAEVSRSNPSSNQPKALPLRSINSGSKWDIGSSLFSSTPTTPAAEARSTTGEHSTTVTRAQPADSMPPRTSSSIEREDEDIYGDEAVKRRKH